VDADPDGFEAALREHLDKHGLGLVRIENAGIRMPASRTAPDHPWVQWARASMQASLGKRVQVIPNSSGGLPGDVFVDHLGVPLVWIPPQLQWLQAARAGRAPAHPGGAGGHCGLRRPLVGPRRGGNSGKELTRAGYASSRRVIPGATRALHGHPILPCIAGSSGVQENFR
jgi:hypothetical protein